MNFQETEEHQMFRETIRNFAEKEVAPQSSTSDFLLRREGHPMS